MQELICIVCPKGCHLKVDENYAVKGNQCPRGAEYGKNELQNPVRVVTSTVKITGGLYRRLPVKTDCAIPKAKVAEIMTLLSDISLVSPVKIGQVLMEKPLGLACNIVSTGEL